MSNHLYDYLLLSLTPHIGPISFAALMKHFGSASAVLSASADEIRPCLERPEAALSALLSRQAESTVEASLKWAEQDDCRLMILTDEDYPLLLAEGMSPPPILFLRGNAQLINQAMIAIVGSRHATPQALQTAEQWGYEIAESGFTIVSGFADGIDSAAHRGALRGKNSTIGILGTGIDRVYPAKNRELAHQMAKKGLLVSEFPLGTAPQAAHFPRRNRIIAALGRATVVIEAAEKSGSLITARLANEFGRDVMAVPGSIYNPQVKGCHRLIRDGAKLVTNAAEILEEYQQTTPTQTFFSLPVPSSQRQPEKNTPTTTHTEQNVYNAEPSDLLTAMGFDAVHPDELVQKLHMHPADLYEQLLTLELAGQIASVAGGRYQRMI